MYHVSGFSSSSPPASYCCIFVDCSAKWKGGEGAGEERPSHSLVSNCGSIPSFPVFLITSDPKIFKSWDIFFSSLLLIPVQVKIAPGVFPLLSYGREGALVGLGGGNGHWEASGMRKSVSLKLLCSFKE